MFAEEINDLKYMDLTQHNIELLDKTTFKTM